MKYLSLLLARWAKLRYYVEDMNLIDIILLFAAALVALLSRSSMKRFLVRRVGKANTALLEIDFWKASSGEFLVRGIVLVELASWAAMILLVLQLAILVLG
jgi:hypothetical protein